MSHWLWFIYDHWKDVTAVESIPEDEEVEQTEVQTSEQVEEQTEEKPEEKTEDLNPKETKPEDKSPEEKTEEEKKEEDEFNIKGLPKLVIVGLGHVLP